MFDTGIKTCEQLKEMSFSGNIIPQIWYKTIVKSDLKHPKPYLLAINILADIVYWYRPTEVRDEETGVVLGYKKKFESDLLRRNYNQFAEMFGCSTGQAKDAIVFLEEMGVINRVLRNKEINGIICNNILFIALNVDCLIELTYPKENAIPTGVCGNFTGGVSRFPQRGDEFSTEPVSKFHRTNTKNTIKTTSKTPSIHLHDKTKSAELLNQACDGSNDKKLIPSVEKMVGDKRWIPYTYRNSEEKMKIALKHIICYDVLIAATYKADFQKDTLDFLLDCLTEMACENKIQTYKGSSVTYAKVIDKLNKVINNDDGLDEFIEETIDDYISAASKQKIKDNKKYMKAVIWNSLSTYKVKFDSSIARMLKA